MNKSENQIRKDNGKNEDLSSSFKFTNRKRILLADFSL